MFKYIKWELKDIISKNTIWLSIIGVVYLLTFFMVKTGADISILPAIFSIIWIIVLFNSFISGTKRVMKSYESKTFLLESTIPMSPEKLLLGKYIISLIINIVYVLIFLIGLFILTSNVVDAFNEIINQLIFNDFGQFLERMGVLTSVTLAYTSVTTLVFIALKSIWPSVSKFKVLSFVIAGFALGQFTSLIFNGDNFYDSSFVVMLIYSVVTVLAFFGTSALIKNKLEIYN